MADERIPKQVLKHKPKEDHGKGGMNEVRTGLSLNPEVKKTPSS
jgi:hypothetical protein